MRLEDLRALVAGVEVELQTAVRHHQRLMEDGADHFSGAMTQAMENPSESVQAAWVHEAAALGAIRERSGFGIPSLGNPQPAGIYGQGGAPKDGPMDPEPFHG